MEIIYLSVLGLVQGITEFLPISSSGHLVIFKEFFGLDTPGVAIEAVLHLGTLCAVVFYYFKDVKLLFINFIRGLSSKLLKKSEFNREYYDLSIYIILGSVPAGIAGLIFKDFFEGFFKNINFVYLFLFITGIVLLSTYYSKQRGKLNIWKSILIGAAQATAIFPGISRSGITIAAAMWVNVEKDQAARFSFLLAMPSILGAVVLSVGDIAALFDKASIGLIFGFLISVFSGYIAIQILLKIVTKNKFFIFGIYCFIISLIGLIF